MYKLLITLCCLFTLLSCKKEATKNTSSTKETAINVYGPTVDNQTRCVHYHSELDIIAIKFKCCKKYYPCYKCHLESEIHKPQVWNATEHNEKAILCGVCKHELTIKEYINSGNKCTSCGAKFNPGCSKHYHFYFILLFR